MTRNKPTRIFDPSVAFEHRFAQIAQLGCERDAEPQYDTVPENHVGQPKPSAYDGGEYTAEHTTNRPLPRLARTDSRSHFIASQTFPNIHGCRITHPNNHTQKKDIPLSCR